MASGHQKTSVETLQKGMSASHDIFLFLRYA